ncbi:TPA: hypothetical protein ENS27_09710 [bacterium]|nr:hypothetical protein [bacterium]
MRKRKKLLQNISSKNISKIFLVLVILAILPMYLSAQVTTNFAAKTQLREWGVYSSKIIEDAETITIEFGQIEASGGISISLPILDFIDESQIILLNGASGYKTNKGTIIIEAYLLYISAVVINVSGRKYLIVGQSLKDIVNYLLR